MLSKNISLILVMILIVAVSGCTAKNSTNGTFGDKNISIDKIVIKNSTADHYEYEGMNYYYVEGYILNNNDYDAFHVKLRVKALDENGTVIATNESVYFENEDSSISARGTKYFYAEFEDPNNITFSYQIEIIDAKSYI